MAQKDQATSLISSLPADACSLQVAIMKARCEAVGGVIERKRGNDVQADGFRRRANEMVSAEMENTADRILARVRQGFRLTTEELRSIQAAIAAPSRRYFESSPVASSRVVGVAALALAEVGHYSEARVVAARRVAAMEHVSGKRSEDYASALLGLATVEHYCGNPARSVDLCEEAIAILEQCGAKSVPALPTIHVNAATAAVQAGDATRAELHAEEASKGCEFMPSRDHDLAADVWFGCAAVWLALNRRQTAEPRLESMRRALSAMPESKRRLRVEIWERRVSEPMPGTLATLHRARLETLLAAQEYAFTQESPRLETTLRALSQLAADEGRPDVATRLSERADRLRGRSMRQALHLD
jgi:hypothetical protein